MSGRRSQGAASASLTELVDAYLDHQRTPRTHTRYTIATYHR